MSAVLHLSGREVIRVTVVDAALAPALALAQATAASPHLLIEPQDDVLAYEEQVAGATRISVNFPKFTDGRGYSTAVLLRTRLNYRGVLRAVGDVLVDQVLYLARAGFDEIELRADQKVADALRALQIVNHEYLSKYSAGSKSNNGEMALLSKEYVE
jgi:uncharacterized protein (DUF934 family)